jgi:hypothetical protein
LSDSSENDLESVQSSESEYCKDFDPDTIIINDLDEETQIKKSDSMDGFIINELKNNDCLIDSLISNEFDHNSSFRKIQ